MSSPVDTTFVSGTTITSDWLNGVNDHVNNIEADPHPIYAQDTELAAADGASRIGFTSPDATSKVVSDLAIQNSSTKGAALVGFYDTIAPAYLKTVSDIANGNEVSLFRFIPPAKHAGIRAETNTDDLTTSFQDAALAAKCVFVPYGKYNVSDATAISKQGARWRGEGIEATKINSTVNNKSIFTINGSLNGVEISDLQLVRSVTAIVGGYGIDCHSVTIGQARLRNLLIDKQYYGLFLGPTDWSEIEKCIIQRCQSHGLYLTNTASDGTCQWSSDSVLSQKNAGSGFFVQSIAGPAQLAMGTFKKCATYANSGTGLSVTGLVGVPIYGVRIDGGFYGGDGNSDIYLDTYGGMHQINGVYTELAGQTLTGPNVSTAASGIGAGFQFTANNTDVTVSGCRANGHSYSGFLCYAESTSISGSRATNNGLAGIAGFQNGVDVKGTGRVNVTGGAFGNTGGSTTQKYGVFGPDGQYISVVGADLTSNATAPFGATANANYITAVGNFPNNANVQLSPAGAVLVGAATGGFSAAGTVNVAGGLLKNNTAYTNP